MAITLKANSVFYDDPFTPLYDRTLTLDLTPHGGYRHCIGARSFVAFNASTLRFINSSAGPTDNPTDNDAFWLGGIQTITRPATGQCQLTFFGSIVHSGGTNNNRGSAVFVNAKRTDDDATSNTDILVAGAANTDGLFNGGTVTLTFEAVANGNNYNPERVDFAVFGNY